MFDLGTMYRSMVEFSCLSHLVTVLNPVPLFLVSSYLFCRVQRMQNGCDVVRSILLAFTLKIHFLKMSHATILQPVKDGDLLHPLLTLIKNVNTSLL
jgi:hypothetical protein